MAYQKPGITVDWRQFRKQLSKMSVYYPLGVARGFQRLTAEARDDMRAQARRVFDLRSDFIPNGILSTPHTQSQIRAATKSVEKYHDITGSVFLRPSATAKRSLAFLVPHETGEAKKPNMGGDLAIPASGLENYNYRASRGGVRKRWKPKTLLKEFNIKGPNKLGHKIHTRKKGRGKGAPFVIQGKSGTWMVARRKTPRRKELEFLYSFKGSARIRPVLQMEETVHQSVRINYTRILGGQISRGFKRNI